MSWRFIFGESLAALRYYSHRTLFTTLSLAWGVACFVILMSYGEGFERALVKAFTAVGQDLIITFGGQTSLQAGGMRTGRKIQLEYDHAAVIKESVPLVEFLSPEIMRHGLKMQYRGREKEATVRAVWPEYAIIRNIRIADGRWIHEEDRMRRHRVAVLGYEVAREVFGEAPAVNEEITLNGLRFTVIGVMDNKLQISNYNRRDNQCIFIPYETFSLFGDIRHPWFYVWMYRPRFLGQFFELSSCGSLEGKQGLVSLPRGLEVEPFDQPLFVVALAEFFERFGEFFQGFEVPHPEKLLFEGAEEAFDATVAFRLADEGR